MKKLLGASATFLFLALTLSACVWYPDRGYGGGYHGDGGGYHDGGYGGGGGWHGDDGYHH